MANDPREPGSGDPPDTDQPSTEETLASSASEPAFADDVADTERVDVLDEILLPPSRIIEPIVLVPSQEISIDDLLSADEELLLEEVDLADDPPTEPIAPEDILSLDEAGVRLESVAAPPPTPILDDVPQPRIVPREFAIEIPSALDDFLREASAETLDARVLLLEAALLGAPAATKGEIAYELGELYQADVGDEAKAVKAFGVALRSDPSLRANLWAIRRIFYRRGLWPNLVKLIGAELRFVKTDRERADLELERGHIHEDRLGDPSSAKACYERALAHDPGYRLALVALERQCLVGNDRAGLARVWRRLADTTADAERKQIYLIDLAHALADANDESAFDVLDEAVACGDQAIVSRERLRAARRLGSPEQRVKGLEEFVSAELATLGAAGLPPPSPINRDAPPSAVELVRGRVIAARRRQSQILLRELGDTDRAWAALEQALLARPGDSLVLADLSDLAESSGRFQELAELVASWQAQEVAPERARALALRRVYALRRSGDKVASAALVSQLAATYPGYLPIGAIRELDAMSGGDVTSLIDVYSELAESAELGSLHGEEDGAAEPALAAEYFCAAGGAAQLAGDLSRARTLYGRALDCDPASEAARDGLATCLEKAGDWAGIAELLSPVLSREGDPHWRIRAAHAALAGREKEGAIEFLASVGDELTTGELLWLAALAIERGDPAREAFALEKAADRESDVDACAEMLARAGRALEMLDWRRAASLYRRALQARPDDSLCRGALTALLRREEDWKGLTGELRDAAGSGSDPRGPVAAWHELAALYEDRLGDPGAAADAYREVLEIDGDNVAALSGLIRTTDGAERLDALERASQCTEQATALVAALELARAQLAASDLEGANRSAERADFAERDLGHRTRAGAILAIECAVRAGDHRQIADALEGAADGSRGGVAADLLAAAGWQRFLGDDVERAAALFSAAVAFQRDNRSALFGALMVATGEDEAVAAETLAQALEGDALAASMLRGAGVHAAVSGEEGRALELLARAVRRAPDDLGAAIALTEMTAPGVAHADAAALAYGRRAQARGGGAAELSLERARYLACAGRLAEAGQLALELSRSGDSDPAPVALLADICRRGEDIAGEARATLELASRIVCRLARARHLRRAASLFDRSLGSASAAAPAYWQLCEIEPAAPERARLAEILYEAEDFGSLWELYSSEIDSASSSSARASALIARARVRLQIADRHGAARDLGRARDEDAEAAAEAGADLVAAEIGEWIELPVGADAELAVASISERAESMTDVAAKARQLVDVATLCRDAIGDRRRAANAIARARALDPTNLEAAVRAGEVAEAALAIRAGLAHEAGHRVGYQKLAAALELLGDVDESALAREVADAIAGAASANPIDVSPLCEIRRPIDPEVLDRLSARRRGERPTAEILWEKIADAVSRQIDPSPSDLGLALTDRVSVRELGKRSPVAAALYERLRLHAEVYVVTSRSEFAMVTSANRQMIFISPDVADATSPQARFLLGAALTLCRERTGTLVRLAPARVATFFAAARSLAGAAGGPLGAVTADVPAAIDALEKLLPARAISELSEMREALEALDRPSAWMREASRRADRFGVAVSGDIAAAVRVAARPGRPISSDERALDLLAFAASERHLELRRALGIVA